jgi:hypothetical protein
MRYGGTRPSEATHFMKILSVPRARSVGGRLLAVALLGSLAMIQVPRAGAADATAADDALELFKTWLNRAHAGFGCDDGPAAFINPAVQAAYPGRKFYYVLTHARGIPPPFKNSLSLVASIDAEGNIRPLDEAFPDNYQLGLIEVTRETEARQAAGAVLILALGDPAERRWKIDPSSIRVKKKRKEWICTYEHGDSNHVSIVTFDRHGLLTALRCNTPPVP